MTRFQKFANQDLGEYWFRELFPDHFKPSARTEFQYMPRDEEWLKSKRLFGRGQGKRDDLVFSGKSRRFLSVGPIIKATGRGVSVRLTGPIYFKNPRHKTPGHPDKPEEVTRVSRRHRFLLARRFGAKMSGLVERFLRTARPEQIR
ncbi:MAG: hypothetical protein IH899_01405 [Planctomycetes bacterium]|nr:hypothetical protein [Planctomycetota bacterium]